MNGLAAQGRWSEALKKRRPEAPPAGPITACGRRVARQFLRGRRSFRVRRWLPARHRPQNDQEGAGRARRGSAASGGTAPEHNPPTRITAAEAARSAKPAGKRAAMGTAAGGVSRPACPSPPGPPPPGAPPPGPPPPGPPPPGPPPPGPPPCGSKPPPGPTMCT